MTIALAITVFCLLGACVALYLALKSARADIETVCADANTGIEMLNKTMERRRLEYSECFHRAEQLEAKVKELEAAAASASKSSESLRNHLANEGHAANNANKRADEIKKRLEQQERLVTEQRAAIHSTSNTINYQAAEIDRLTSALQLAVDKRFEAEKALVAVKRAKRKPTKKAKRA